MVRSTPLHRPRPARFQALGLACAFALVASCSGGDESGESPPTSTTPTSSGAGAATQAEPSAAAQLAFEEAIGHLVKSEPDQAKAKLRQVIEMAPDMAEARFELGRLLCQGSFLAIGERDPAALSEGLSHLQRACELDPQRDLFFYWFGRGLHIGQRNKEAEVALRQAVMLNPENGAAHKRLGLLYRDMEDFGNSKVSFERAIELLPNGDGCWFQLGLVLEALDEIDGARKAYETAISMDRTEPGPYSKLAPLLGAAGDAEGAAEAERNYKFWKAQNEKLRNRMRAVNQDPTNIENVWRLGEIYFVLEKWEQALVRFQQVVVMDPGNAHGHLYCSILQRRMGDLESAETHALEAIGRAPDSLEPILELLRVLAAQDDMERFDTSLERFSEEASEDRDAHVSVGEVCLELELFTRARRFLSRAVELDGEYVPARLAFARLLASQGEDEGAREQLNAALSVDPENADVQAALAALASGESR